MILTPPELASLDSALWWWELGEYASEAVVILGCAGEFIAEFTDLFARGDERKKRRVSKASLLILMIGLAAGLVCLMRATILSGKIIASLNDEAALAGKAAGDANERAAVARGQAAAAQLEADKIEEQMEFRTLKTDQQGQALITAKLRPFAGKHFELDTYRDDPDCVYLSSKFENALESAGWIPRPGETISSNALRMGIIVMVHFGVDEATDKAASELVDDLNAEGLKTYPLWHFPKGLAMQNGNSAALDDETITITVGKKPK
jgi:hypothetical protein